MERDKNRYHLYEGLYIISATLSEAARAKAIEKINNEVTSRGGEIHKIHEMGRYKLAHDINGKKEGLYVLIYFSVNPCHLQEVYKEYHLHEDLLRFMTLRADKVPEEIKFALQAE